MAGRGKEVMVRARKCRGRCWSLGKCNQFELGYFHGWGKGYEEFENGAVSYSTAIVELPDGRVIAPLVDDIVFSDTVERIEKRDVGWGAAMWNALRRARRLFGSV